jgi:hypothetical protein
VSNYASTLIEHPDTHSVLRISNLVIAIVSPVSSLFVIVLCVSSHYFPLKILSFTPQLHLGRNNGHYEPGHHQLTESRGEGGAAA